MSGILYLGSVAASTYVVNNYLDKKVFTGFGMGTETFSFATGNDLERIGNVAGIILKGAAVGGLMGGVLVTFPAAILTTNVMSSIKCGALICSAVGVVKAGLFAMDVVDLGSQFGEGVDGLKAAIGIETNTINQIIKDIEKLFNEFISRF